MPSRRARPSTGSSTEMPTLIDGREVSSDSEAWRHETEARSIAALPGLPQRRAWLEDIEKKRGKVAADMLRATMKLLWEAKK